MAKLTDIYVDVWCDDVALHIKTPVSVTKEGIFSTTLPESSVQELEKYGLPMEVNRNGRKGYFCASTLNELKQKIEDYATNAMRRELVSEEEIIKYKVVTAGSCCADKDGNIYPNGRWGEPGSYDKGEVQWVRFTKKSDACNPVVPQISAFAIVVKRKRYNYPSGLETMELEPIFGKDKGSSSNLDWLKSQVCILYDKRELEWLPELPATEENASFFVTLIKYIYTAAMAFSKLVNPDYVEAFVKSKEPFLLQPGATAKQSK